MGCIKTLIVFACVFCLWACSDPSDTNNANLGDDNYYEVQFVESSILSTDSPPVISKGNFVKSSALILDGALYLGRANLKFDSNSGNAFNRSEPTTGFNYKIFVPTQANYSLENKITLSGKKVSEALYMEFDEDFPEGAYMYKGTRTLSGTKEGSAVSKDTNIFLLSPQAYSFIKYKGIQL
jgi:hypothetical protein